MKLMKTRSKMDKMNLFSLLADSDYNRSLSYDEILFLAKMSLKQNFKFVCTNFDEDKFLLDLSESFCKLVFQICKVDPTHEIQID